MKVYILLGIISVGFVSTAATPSESRKGVLSKRTPRPGVDCVKVAAEKVPWGDYQQALKQVQSKQNCHAPRGWGGCETVGCHNGATIKLCNDVVNNELNVSCHTVATLANGMAEDCKDGDLVKGQVFYQFGGLNYNVIIKKEGCPAGWSGK